MTWGIRTRMILGAGFPIVISIVVVAFVAGSAVHVRGAVARGEESQRVLEATDEMLTLLPRLIIAQDSYLLSGESRHLDTYNATHDEIRTAGTALLGAVSTEGERAQVEALLAKIVHYNDLARTAQRDTAQASPTSGVDAGARASDVATEAIEIASALVATEKATHAAAQAEVDASVDRLTQVVTIGGIAIAGLSLASGGVIATSTGRDIEHTVGRLAGSSAQMAHILGHQDQQASRQARLATDTAATMARIAAAARTSHEQAANAATRAREALDMSENGTAALQQMVAGLDALRRKVEEVSGQIDRLNRESTEIGAITLLVGDLANQTTMLALNAAAEAARAGEHGKGFTTVAAEVRKLANQSHNSAERIAALVGEIQRSTLETVALTEAEHTTLATALETSRHAAKAFEGIMVTLHESSEGAQTISASARDQAESIRRVLESMESVRARARETAEGLKEARKSVADVEETTARLKAMV